MIRQTLLACALALATPGCLYTNVSVPLSYGSATPSDSGRRRRARGDGVGVQPRDRVAPRDRGRGVRRGGEGRCVVLERAVPGRCEIGHDVPEHPLRSLPAAVHQDHRAPPGGRGLGSSDGTGQVIRRLAQVLVAGAALPACMFSQAPVPAPGDGVALAVTRDALQYRSPLPHDVGAAAPSAEARGKACRTTLSFPPAPQDPFYGANVVVAEIPWNPVNIAFKDMQLRQSLGQGRRVGRARTDVRRSGRRPYNLHSRDLDPLVYRGRRARRQVTRPHHVPATAPPTSARRRHRHR